MSIATTLGDNGQTQLIGGRRVPKSDLRVEAYGTIDELGAQLGFARSICAHEDTRTITRQLQQQLFGICEVVASPPDPDRDRPVVTPRLIDTLTEHVHRLEQIDGLLVDWAVPGEHPAAAAFDVARTICRRAERAVVRATRAGEAIDQPVVPYLNRLSDLLWLLSRLVEHDAGVDARLRTEETDGSPWTRAW